ncbi:MAG: response regulator transcription factor [Chloroflexota bacterium]|nr:response regulator transcription factor [Chloroflexota bacterium]
MNKISVVLADDHALVREGTRSLLEAEQDIEVVGEAGDGEEAVTLVAKLRPNVVLMDIAMPKINGIEATRQIKASHPATAVLILTAYDNDQYIFALLDAGAAGYLLKNVKGVDLVNAVRSVCAGEAVLHPVIANKIFARFADSKKEGGNSFQPQHLSEREMEVLMLAAQGKTNQEIAERLHLSRRTVQAHLSNIFLKMNVGSRTEAVLEALKRGWFILNDIV